MFEIDWFEINAILEYEGEDEREIKQELIAQKKMERETEYRESFLRMLVGRY